MNAGFEIIAKYFSSVDTDLKYDAAEVIKRENELKDCGVTFRRIDLDKYEQELEMLHEFNAIAFETNFLYTPIDKEGFIKKYAETKSSMDTDFVILAHDRDNKLIGYFFA